MLNLFSDILMPMEEFIVGYKPHTNAELQHLKYIGGIVETAYRGFMGFLV